MRRPRKPRATVNAAIELAPIELQPDLYERLGEIWAGGDQGVEAFDKANELGRQLGLGEEQELRTLAQSAIVDARWAGSVSQRRSVEEGERRFDRLRVLVAQPFSERARLLGYLALSFGPANLLDLPGPDVIEAARVSANQALELARALDDPDGISAALDALGSIGMNEDRMADVSQYTEQRMAIADRLATNERVDAWIVSAWAAALLGDLEGSQQASAQARAGLGSGQAPGWALGASAWRGFVLHSLGRWDEALVELQRAAVSWQELEIRAPWFALNGFLAGLAIARARRDPIGIDQWRTAARTVFERSDPGIRTQRLAAYVEENLPELERAVLDEFHVFAGRLDYVYLACQLLADRRHPAATATLDQIIDHADERSLKLISCQARRLRGLVKGDVGDLTSALVGFEAMGARANTARLRTELGLLTGDSALLGRGIDELEALGDDEQLARVAAEQRAAATQAVASNAPSGIMPG